ncbi:MAG: hypothetical protein CR993_01555 [Rhodobacterales bacterium]|nr:MAG: hypothetical protein CR993_01555 [Rhodobacterales bacterium]
MALYLTGRGFALSLADEGAGNYAVVGWAVFCTLAVIVVRYLGTRENGSPPQIPAVVISTLSFLVWIYSIGDVPALYGVYFPSLGALLVMSMAVLAPLVYKGN